MQCFLGCSSLLLYVLSAINGLITQRSVVQIHPPQPLTNFSVPIGSHSLPHWAPLTHHKSHRAIRSELPHCWRHACPPTWPAYRHSSCFGWWNAGQFVLDFDVGIHSTQQARVGMPNGSTGTAKRHLWNTCGLTTSC